MSPRRLAAIAALSVLAVLLVADNFVVVEFRLVGWSVAARLGWVILISIAVGFVAGRLTRTAPVSSEEEDHRSRG